MTHAGSSLALFYLFTLIVCGCQAVPTHTRVSHRNLHEDRSHIEQNDLRRTEERPDDVCAVLTQLMIEISSIKQKTYKNSAAMYETARKRLCTICNKPQLLSGCITCTEKCSTETPEATKRTLALEEILYSIYNKRNFSDSKRDNSKHSGEDFSKRYTDRVHCCSNLTDATKKYRCMKRICPQFLR